MLVIELLVAGRHVSSVGSEPDATLITSLSLVTFLFRPLATTTTLPPRLLLLLRRTTPIEMAAALPSGLAARPTAGPQR